MFGHVVASDVFGEAYVIPIDATLKSIKIQLGASAVYLPTLHPDYEKDVNMLSGSGGESLGLQQLEDADQYKTDKRQYFGASPPDSGYVTMWCSPGKQI